MHDVVSSLRIIGVVFEVLKVFQDSKLNDYLMTCRNGQLNLNDALTALFFFPEILRVGFVLRSRCLAYKSSIETSLENSNLMQVWLKCLYEVVICDYFDCRIFRILNIVKVSSVFAK